MTTLTIDPARLEDGGDVRAAHSYDRLAPRGEVAPIVKAAEIDGHRYTVTSLGHECAEAYRLHAPPGPGPRRRAGEFAGRQVVFRGVTYILGNAVRLVAEPAAASDATAYAPPEPAPALPLTEVAVAYGAEEAAAEPGPADAMERRAPALVAVDRSPYLELAPGEIAVSPHNPREGMDEAALRELAESLRAEGVLQPLVVTRQPAGSARPYRLVAGARRLAAARIAGLTWVPAVVRDVQDEREERLLQLVENLQRVDLNPVETARGYAALVAAGLTQSEIARRVGRDASTISNAIRILTLPESVLAQVAAGALSLGHAKSLLRFATWPAVACAIAERAMAHATPVGALNSRRLPFAEELVAQGLARDLALEARFDTALCRQCPYDSFVGGCCVRPEHFDALQQEADARAAEAAEALRGEYGEPAPDPAPARRRETGVRGGERRDPRRGAPDAEYEAERAERPERAEALRERVLATTLEHGSGRRGAVMLAATVLRLVPAPIRARLFTQFDVLVPPGCDPADPRQPALLDALAEHRTGTILEIAWRAIVEVEIEAYANAGTPPRLCEWLVGDADPVGATDDLCAPCAERLHVAGLLDGEGHEVAARTCPSCGERVGAHLAACPLCGAEEEVLT